MFIFAGISPGKVAAVLVSQKNAKDSIPKSPARHPEQLPDASKEVAKQAS